MVHAKAPPARTKPLCMVRGGEERDRLGAGSVDAEIAGLTIERTTFLPTLFISYFYLLTSLLIICYHVLICFTPYVTYLGLSHLGKVK
jgi:hypothetical protein